MKRNSLPQIARGLTVVLVLLSVLSVGCNNDDVLPKPLAGSQWRLVAWSVSSLYPGDFNITADFDETNISGTAAVNFYSGLYTTSLSGAFSVGTLTMTEMAGPENAMRAEALYTKLLLESRRYIVEGTTLTLMDGNGNQLLIFARK